MPRPAALTIVHLSDLQFGDLPSQRGKVRAMEERASLLHESIARDLDALASAYRIQPDILVVTGDIAQRSTGAEYGAALSFIQCLESTLGLPDGSVFAVPGNHDVSWSVSRRLLPGRRPPGPLPSDTHEELLSRFATFANRGGILTPYADGRPRAARLARVPVDLLLLDSTLCESHHKAYHFGYVSEEELDRIIEEMDAGDPGRTRLRIAITHHNALARPIQTCSIRNGDRVLDILAQAGFSVFLNGHIHLAEAYSISTLGGNPIAVCSTGRAIPEEESTAPAAPRYQILSVDPTGAAHSYLLMRKLERAWSDSGLWVCDPAGARSETGVVRFWVSPQSRSGPEQYVYPINAALESLTSLTDRGTRLSADSGLVLHINDFHALDFEALFRGVTTSADFVNTYGGSWLRQKLRMISTLIREREVLLRICLTDPDSAAGPAAAVRHTGHTLEEFREVVSHSIRSIEDLFSQSQDVHGRVQVFLSPRPILYTMYRFDDLAVYAPLPQSSDFPGTSVPAFLIAAEDMATTGFARFVKDDVARLLEHDSRLVFDSRPAV